MNGMGATFTASVVQTFAFVGSMMLTAVLHCIHNRHQNWTWFYLRFPIFSQYLVRIVITSCQAKSNKLIFLSFFLEILHPFTTCAFTVQAKWGHHHFFDLILRWYAATC
jgi:hypothetical protein